MLDSRQSWVVLGGLFVLYMAVIGIQGYTLPLFYPFLISEFGWTTSEVTRAATICYFLGAFLSLVLGPFYDRFPARRLMLAGAALFCVGLWFYPNIRTLDHMLMIYAMCTVAQVCTGQVPVLLVLTRWFRKKRGVAIGIVVTATSAGGAVFPLVLRPLLAEGDWHTAVRLLSVLALLMFVLPILFLIRERPESSNELQNASDSIHEHRGPTLADALRSPVFYLLAFSTGGIWFITNGMVQHQSILLGIELGLDQQTVPLVVSVYFWGAIAGKLLLGWLADRLDKNIVMLLGIVSVMLGLTALRVSGAEGVYWYAVCFGLGFGGTFAMIQVLIAHYFAGSSYGRILAVLTTVDVLAGGVGISLLGTWQRSFGSYMPVLTILLVVAIAVAASVILLLLYGRKTTQVAQASSAGVSLS